MENILCIHNHALNTSLNPVHYLVPYIISRPQQAGIFLRRIKWLKGARDEPWRWVDSPSSYHEKV